MEEEFKDIKEPEENSENSTEQIVTRVKLPRGKEVIGIIESRLGGNRMNVDCLDGKARNCRVPGRLRRKLWLRPNDIVIVLPWELDNTKGDLLFKYRPAQIAWLKQHGHLQKEQTEF
ncbi:MAG: translation initiation factor eIF-1A [Nanoarchaeota archaeon]|nr:translation initiation factor eIF-1A [Nanoarchaeota archaeon]